jgi:hypothetical protein
VLAWLVVVLLTALDLSPLGWALLAGGAVALSLAGLFGRRKAVDARLTLAFTPACILLGWPILAVASAAIRYWVSGQALGE